MFVPESVEKSGAELKTDMKSSLDKVLKSTTPKPDEVNLNNMSEKLRQVLERKTVIDHVPSIKEEIKEVKPKEPELESDAPDIVPKLEPVIPDMLGSDVFNEVEITSEIEITSEVEVSTSEDTTKPKEEPMDVNENTTDDGRSVDSESTIDNETSNEASNPAQDSSSCETSSNIKVPEKNLLQDSSKVSNFSLFGDSTSNTDKLNLLSDENSQSSSKPNSEVGEEVDVVSSEKCEEDSVSKPKPVERILKSDSESGDSEQTIPKVVVTTTSTTTTTTTHQVTTVDGVIKSVRTTESVSSESSKTIKLVV